MSYIQNLFTSRDNNAQGNTYVGQEGRIWWNPDTNAFYYSDGNTAGGIPVGTGGGGPGVPGGPTNSIQYNAGGGSFGGSANLVVSGTGLSAVGNIAAAWFIGNVSATGNIAGGNIFSNNYLYANGQSIFANISLTGNVNLGNLYVSDQTIYGKNLNANIGLSPEGDGWVTVPKIDIDGMTIANTGTALQFDTDAGIDIQFGPGTGGNILTAGTIKPTGNNTAGLGAAGSRYTDLWLGSGNINLIDQTLNQNQQIYANQGNLIIGNATGLSFGNFLFYGNVMALANAAANIEIGTANATGWVQFNRAIAVSTQVGQTAFAVERDGTVEINVPGGIPGNTAGALNIVATADGAYQNVTNSGGVIHATGPNNSIARVTIDAFGTSVANSVFGQFIGRAGRGTANVPVALQANDVMARFGAAGWIDSTNKFAPQGLPTPTAIEMVAAEALTANTLGSKINIYVTPIGSNVRTLATTVNGNGINFPNTGAGGTGNLGITFQDGSFQNTAYSPSNSVSSLTAGAGINLSGSTGNITITNTGILGVNGTPNRVLVTSNVAGVVTLSTPQDLNTTANVTLYSLTVTDLSIIGNVSNVIPSTVDGPVVYVANTATVYNNINNSGLVIGNIANNVSAGILYKTSSNTWNFDYGNAWGITANTVYGNTGQFNDLLHVGFGNATIDFPNASLQADCNIDSYNQIVIHNHFQGANASSDFVAVANNGDDSSYYIDMGINSNVYNNADYAVTGPNDGYLYVNGGNLIIGTQTANKTIRFFTGGTNTATNVRGTLSDSGLSMVGNVSANNFAGNTVSVTTVSATTVTGTTVSATGVVTAPSITGGIVSTTGTITGGNLRTGGSISATGNVTAGNLITATTVIDGGVSTTGTVTAANISGANITASGTVSAIGNISTPNLNASIAIVSTLLSITGNIDGGNLRTSGIISTTGNATFGNVQTTGRVSVTGNIDGGNVRTAGLVTATGNISTAGYFLGDGGLLSNITASTGTKIVNGTSWANIAASGGNLVMAIAGNTIGTISAGGANITGYASVSGNVTGGNLVGQNLTAGRVAIVGSGKEVSDDAEFTYNSSTNVLSVAGNINATNFIGNLISATNVSNVGNLYVQGNIQYNLNIDDGGNVTQLTNKSTAVTCNGRTGRITTSGAALAGGTEVTFVVNNTYVQQYDLIILNIKDPVRANTYLATVAGVGTNSFNIMITNLDNNSHSDAIVLSFAVIQVR